MLKIPTLFDRIGDIVVDRRSDRVDPIRLATAVATEKVDGTNIRLTLRNTVVVRVEKRRNPTRQQKEMAILHPWYVDAVEADPNDKWIFKAVYGLDSQDRNLPDGEYEVEAYGESIQGNPLGVVGQHLYWFSVQARCAAWSGIAPTYHALKGWASSARTIVPSAPAPASWAMDVRPEGLVWHDAETWRPIAKIKRRDFGEVH